ncbi:hypothetical protein PR202_ga17795 [Eleusine coracana subsp. coracana]|uniref:GOLD domain-containing protein n=1 Tax=Eleusine coracana subsp. coracana TaxID=191504 RepID=A0AAV5CR20_ELECO|nr:hypothetical protein QOZ80_6AG0513250 [Eleusine coracana subsp. coracana]GJN00370.1 hypothetical protein PR202_ga17548 [Eleusine coracana subsp. coracana]GJN00603.1 hypothetical protein PR202_ga17795 [Eleusine coracana subsp. coracana]
MARPTAPAVVLALAAAVAMLLLLLSPGAEAVWLELPPSGTKCVSEEIQPNVVVVADYAIMFDSHPTGHPTVAVKVTSPYGNTVHQNANATTGQFAFTTSEAGNYLACFWVDSAEKGSGVSLNLDWKIGIGAKDWDTVAKKEKIEGVELELRKLEAAVESIHHNLLYLRAREAEMRTVSEKTNSRVAWFSILSLAVCIVVSVLNLWHLQGFFRKKKLI